MQWYDSEHTGLSCLLLIHDFDCRILSTICYLIYLLLPMQSGFQTNWESASVFPLRSTHILANDSSVPCPRRTQAGSPGQIKADSQCWCLVLLFLFPSFSEAALSSETPLNFFSPTFYFFSPNPPNFSPIPLQISSKP